MLLYWLWLAGCKDIRDGTKTALVRHFEDPEDIFRADKQTLRAADIEGLTEKQADVLLRHDLRDAERVLTDCMRLGIRVLTFGDARYPKRMKELYDAPVVLFYKGTLPDFDNLTTVALVGTRHASDYGRQAAARLGGEIAAAGGLVVSGLAEGIDAAAMGAALAQGVPAVGVLGCGADIVYPPKNSGLFRRTEELGCILSEFAPGSPPLGWHFPKRNRIISGLSCGVLVVEAPEKSGALITANTALEQGRDVFAVPGPINADTSRGCNQLIRDGAGLVMEAWDVLGTYQQRFPQRLRPIRAAMPETPRGAEEEAAQAPAKPERQQEKPPAMPVLDLAKEGAALTDDQKRILRVLPADRPLLADEAAVMTELPVRRVLSALTMLEIDGYVRRQGAGSFLRTVELREE